MTRKAKHSEDNRFKRRVPIEQEVEIQCEDLNQFRTEQAENISEGGIFIKTDRPFSPGTVFRLSILVGPEKIETKAQVIWTKEFSNDENRVSGMGAHFIDLNDRARDFLRNFIQEKPTA